MRVPAGAKIGRYTVEKLIGVGGMGEVYLARDEELHRPVAIKLLSAALRDDREFQRRLKHEARAASALNHPNILTVHEIGEANGEHFIATEFVEGVPLRSRIGHLSLLELVKIVEHVAEALTAAEAAGIVHRDIKPDNIMIRNDGYVKVLDFGLARRHSEGQTNREAISGTIHYMSPEQLRGEPLDSRTDVWSLGVVLCELATGKLPFEGSSPADVISSIVGQAGPTVEGPLQLQPIVRRALEKERELRYSNMREMLAEIRAVRRRLETERSGAMVTIVGVETPAETVATPLPSISRRRRSNIPVLLTSLVGREHELEEVKAMLARPEVRLVTLTGPGGTGKTRLALQLALEAVPLFDNGVFYVSLASVSDPALVLPAIAAALGLRDDAGGSLLETIKRELSGEDVLLVLDNLEQVVECGPLLTELLEQAPGAKLLATSQATLRLRGENEYAVPPLPLPGTADGMEDLAANPAVDLFVQRAKAIDPAFELTSANADAVSGICRRLDGLPLAIELAAARIRLISPAAILSRLEHRLELLTGGSRDLPTRQQTMHAAISWGFNLLEEGEKRLLARMSIFDDGATLDAIEKVCAMPTMLDIHHGLESLVDRSFVRRERQGDGELRFSLLGTIREFAQARLSETGEEEPVRRAHAEWFVRFAAAAEQKLESREQQRWLERLEREHDNLESAMQWAIAHRDEQMALRLASSLWWFWYLRGHYAEGRRWVESALEIAGDGADEKLRAAALVGAGVLAMLQCDYDHARNRLDEAVQRSEASGDRESRAAATQALGSIARETGQYARSLELHRQALTTSRETGDRAAIARSLNYIGFASWLSGDYATPEKVCTEALAIFSELRDGEGIAWSTMNLAAAANCQGRAEAAMSLAKEALTASQAAGFKEGIAWSLNILGVVTRRRGQRERAEGFLRKSFAFHWELGDRWRAASVVEALAGVLADAQRYEDAAMLFGAARKLRTSIGTPVPPAEQFDFEQDLARTQRALGDSFGDHFATGAATPVYRLV